MVRSSKDISKEIVKDVRILYEACKKEIEAMGIQIKMGASSFTFEGGDYFVYITIRNNLGGAGGYPVDFHIYNPTKEKVYEVLSRLLEVLRVISCFKEEEYGEEGEFYFLANTIHDDSVAISVDFFWTGCAYEFKYVEGVGVKFKYNLRDELHSLGVDLGTTEDMNSLRSRISAIINMGNDEY